MGGYPPPPFLGYFIGDRVSITKAAMYKGFYRIQRVSLFVTLTLVHYCTGVSIWKLVDIRSLHQGGLLRFHPVYRGIQGFLRVNEGHPWKPRVTSDSHVGFHYRN